MTVTPNDILNTAKWLLGSPYRYWTDDVDPDPIPMWQLEGYGTTYETLPPTTYFLSEQQGGQGYGVECSDLINYALIYNGLPHIEGTQNAINHLREIEDFDYWKSGAPGYVAYLPYDAASDQGHIALYWDDTYLIQAIHPDGVTYWYTDKQTYDFPGGDCAFTKYAKLPGVTYPDDV